MYSGHDLYPQLVDGTIISITFSYKSAILLKEASPLLARLNVDPSEGVTVKIRPDSIALEYAITKDDECLPDLILEATQEEIIFLIDLLIERRIQWGMCCLSQNI